MGRIYTAPLSGLALSLARALDIDTFVETGTHHGHATRWAAEHFRRVWTVEISAEYQAVARSNLAAFDNVSFVLADSAVALSSICAQLERPALFWLDAHAGGGNFGSDDICPLLAEIDTVASAGVHHVIMIDDARAFIAPPPPPFDAAKWPSLDQIFRCLQSHRDDYVALSNDCLICVPQAARPIVQDYVLKVRPKI
jgi:hypothetical protein